jgi:hypothetical protein
MLYAVLCYNNEEMVFGWSKEEDAAVMGKLKTVHERWGDKLKPSLRLMPTTAATTYQKSKDMVIDGPYAETKEALLGLYLLEVANLDEALRFAKELGAANPGGAYELRPLLLFHPGSPIDGVYTDASYAPATS